VLSGGFVDDTILPTYSKTTETNCRALEGAHEKCLSWAKRHGAAFAADKYRLMHLTRNGTRKGRFNLDATVNIQGLTEGPVPVMTVLEIRLDP
jgi:hypothetical protein